MSEQETLTEAEPLSEGGFRYSERTQILCRTCMQPITWETRAESGFLPRAGWYDDARSDPIVCFRAVEYRHRPLTDREWAYYRAGWDAALSAHLAPPDPARAGDTSGDAKGCGWCGLGAGHTTDEHLARWGNPDTTAAPLSGVAARAKNPTRGEHDE